MTSEHVVFDLIAIGELICCGFDIDTKHSAGLVRVTYCIFYMVTNSCDAP
jgi:hypothetical protein